MALIKRLGLRTMATKFYDIYPDLVRQFMASVWVYYKNLNCKRVYECSITFCIQDIWYTLSIPDLCDI